MLNANAALPSSSSLSVPTVTSPSSTPSSSRTTSSADTPTRRRPVSRRSEPDPLILCSDHILVTIMTFSLITWVTRSRSFLIGPVVCRGRQSRSEAWSVLFLIIYIGALSEALLFAPSSGPKEMNRIKMQIRQRRSFRDSLGDFKSTKDTFYN